MATRIMQQRPDKDQPASLAFAQSGSARWKSHRCHDGRDPYADRDGELVPVAG